MVPDMNFATLAQCPVLGGKVKHVDDGAAKKIPGVRQVVVLDDLVAVVGDHMWAAWGLDALKVTGKKPNATCSIPSKIGTNCQGEQESGVAASPKATSKGLTLGERFDADSNCRSRRCAMEPSIEPCA